MQYNYCWKLITLFVEIIIQDSLVIKNKEQYLFEIFCNIIYVFTVTFELVNVSMLKTIHLFFIKTNIFDPNLYILTE